jgi:hypothetical protein
MKTSVKIGAIMILMMTALWVKPQRGYAQNENINLQVFYDELGAYGTWIENPDYGYVWVPNVDPGFRPYVTNGHWVFTDYGWTWSSDYPWGWAAFHYGRWYWDEQYGNVWVPGTEWGPAWVIWRRSEGYYGWAPMAPGVSMSESLGRDYYMPADRWCFVRNRDLARYDLGNCFIDRFRYRVLIGMTSVIFETHFDARFNHSYIYGPNRNDFQRHYGRVINPVHIYDNDRPGQSYSGGRLSIYRPQFSKRGEAYNQSRPSNFIGKNERNNNNPNFNNRNLNNNNRTGNINQQPAVNSNQNDRERANALNNNNSNNNNSRQLQQNNRPDYNQNNNNFNRNQNRVTNNKPGNIVSQPNSAVNQNQREGNQVTTPTVDNGQKMNQQNRGQANMNNVKMNRPVQIQNNAQVQNNTPKPNQRIDKRLKPVQDKKSQRKDHSDDNSSKK